MTSLRLAPPFLLGCLLLSCLAPVAAQDLIGVTFTGAVLRLDSQTGATTVLANGQLGKNDLAFTNDNRLWTTVRPGAIPTQSSLAVIDPFTGAESLPFGTTDFGDLRALCQDSLFGGLFAIRDVGGPDELIHINTDTGAVQVIGPTGFSNIQGMDVTSAGARAWDFGAGELLISLSTGAATDPFPAVGSPAGMQFLTNDPVTDRVFTGRQTLYEVNVFNGQTTQLVTFAGNPDLRGLQFTTARGQPFGAPCNGLNGQVFIDLTGPFSGGGTMGVVSVNHQPSCIGLEIIGFSDEFAFGAPLPISLDAVLGTSGCLLHVSPDLTVVGVGQPTGNLVIDLAIPPQIAFLQFYVQHAALEAVPGGMSFSKGMRVRSAL